MKNIFGIMLVGLLVLFISPPATAESLEKDLIVCNSGYYVTDVDVATKSVDYVSTPIMSDYFGLTATRVSFEVDTAYLDDDVGWIGSKLYNYSKSVATSITPYKDVPLLVPLKMNSTLYIYAKGNEKTYDVYRDLPLLVPLKGTDVIS